jgi:hypothetical protein
MSPAVRSSPPNNDNGGGNNDIPRHGPNTNNTNTSVLPWTPNDEPTPPIIQGFGTRTSVDPMGTGTSVDTASLNSFVTFIGGILPSIQDTRTALAVVQVEPGDFYDADQMRLKINGSTGLVGQYHSVLADLDNGLSSIQTGLTTLAAQYSNTEDLNNLSVSQLQTSLGNADSYFGNITTDVGGSNSSTSTANSPGNSDNSGNSNNSGNSDNSNNSGNSNTGTGS